jgi:hypothetical protein
MIHRNSPFGSGYSGARYPGLNDPGSCGLNTAGCLNTGRTVGGRCLGCSYAKANAGLFTKTQGLKSLDITRTPTPGN